MNQKWKLEKIGLFRCII
jgi:DNA invertase Pin-like site-specific DNA recombinase